MLLIGFAFLSGLVTILAPCIWPLLPIVLAASASGKSHKRPLGITLGIVVSFSILTLLLSLVIRFFHIDPNVLRILAVIILLIFGVSLLIPSFGGILELFISRLSGLFGQKPGKTNTGFGSGFVTGLSLGVVWTPCAGPILATIATLAALGKLSFLLIGMMVAYAIGVAIPLFLFAYGGQQIVSRTKFISKYTGLVQQVFGVIILLTALAIFTNYDVVIQNRLLDMFPGLNSSLANIGNNTDVTQQINTLKGVQVTTSNNSDNNLFNVNVPAPGFTGGTKWLNLPTGMQVPTIENLKGKVVLVDFWTYTCINCIRTLPHVTAWYDKYNKDGFVVIGVHSPEFSFEHETANVENAIKMFKIHYPVVQDNDLAIWNNYNNEYWPAEYLIDANGVVRRTEFGEGNYDETEKAIQTLLKEAGDKQIPTSFTNISDQTPQNQISPESYLGANRMQYYYPNGSVAQGTFPFKLATNLPTNTFSYGGTWNIEAEDAIAEKNATLQYNFTAEKVFLVLKPPASGNGTVKVLLDGKPINENQAGNDVKNGTITITTDRLYDLINFHGKTENHILELDFQTPGTEGFAFTFG